MFSGAPAPPVKTQTCNKDYFFCTSYSSAMFLAVTRAAKEDHMKSCVRSA